MGVCSPIFQSILLPIASFTMPVLLGVRDLWDLGSETAQRLPGSVDTDLREPADLSPYLEWQGWQWFPPRPHAALTAALTVANSTTAVPAFLLESTKLSTSPYCGDKEGPAHAGDKPGLPWWGDNLLLPGSQRGEIRDRKERTF